VRSWLLIDSFEYSQLIVLFKLFTFPFKHHKCKPMWAAWSKIAQLKLRSWRAFINALMNSSFVSGACWNYEHSFPLRFSNFRKLSALAEVKGTCKNTFKNPKTFVPDLFKLILIGLMQAVFGSCERNRGKIKPVGGRRSEQVCQAGLVSSEFMLNSGVFLPLTELVILFPTRNRCLHCFYRIYGFLFMAAKIGNSATNKKTTLTFVSQ